VDDEPAVSTILHNFLRKYLDEFELFAANNGLDAIEKVKEMIDSHGPPHIVLMDLKMPVMDGIEGAQKLSELGVTNIHVLTGFVDPSLIEKAVEIGAKGILKKSEGYGSIATKVADLVRALPIA
jgi:response regulator NasT